MSRESVSRFANELLGGAAGQRDLQSAVNDFASSLVDAGQKRGFEFTVEELGAFLTQVFVPDGSSPETPAHDRRSWMPVITKLLSELRVSNPDHKMFQTMTFDSVGGQDGLEELLAQAASNQAAQAAPAAEEPATPAVDSFEPEDSYYEATTASEKDVEAARQQLRNESGGSQSNKPFWKVW